MVHTTPTDSEGWQTVTKLHTTTNHEKEYIPKKTHERKKSHITLADSEGWQTVTKLQATSNEKESSPKKQERRKSHATILKKEEDSSSEDDSEEEDDFKIIRSPIEVVCPFDNCGKHIKDATVVGIHLKKKHGLIIKNLHHCTNFLQTYLDYYCHHKYILEDKKIPVIKDEAGDSFKFINPEKIPQDFQLRTRLQRDKLNEILVIQEEERRVEANLSRQCLFCSLIFDNRSKLFHHMYQEHGFNIGLPDNLVKVEEFLAILQVKLTANICIYCEKQFTSAIVLRKHMRKKKHFKIHSKNHRYDQYYIVNYAEPNKDWIQLEKEEDEDILELDNTWDSWDEIESEMYFSTFDDKQFHDANFCLKYFKEKYHLDIIKLQKDLDLDFYDLVKLINCLRFNKIRNQCIVCNQKYQHLELLQEHYEATRCLEGITKELPLFEDANLLLPIIENDALIMFMDTLFENEVNTNDKQNQKFNQKLMIEKINQLRIVEDK